MYTTRCFPAGSSDSVLSAAPPAERLTSSQLISDSSPGSNNCPFRDREMRSYLRFSWVEFEAESDISSLLDAVDEANANKLEPAFQTPSKLLQVPARRPRGRSGWQPSWRQLDCIL